MLDYTIWFNDEAPGSDYMWSLGTAEAEKRAQSSDPALPDMFAPLIKNGAYRAFTLLKKDNPEISEAKPITDKVKIIGKNGTPDLLKAILPHPVYENRKITETFVLLQNGSGRGNYHVGDYHEWMAMVSGIVNYFNTFRGDFRIVLSHDPGWYWLGSVTASAVPDGHRAIVTVTADVEPYKYERYDSTEPWIWDDFSFIDGIIRDYGEITVTHGVGEYMTFPIPVRGRDCTPKFKRVTASDADSAVQVSIDGVNWYDAAFEDYAAIDDIVLIGGRLFGETRDLYMRGNGKKISIKMRGESL